MVVTNPRGMLRRLRNVNKHHRCENTFWLPCLAAPCQKLLNVIYDDFAAFGPIDVVNAWKLDKLCVGNMLGQIARVANLADAICSSM